MPGRNDPITIGIGVMAAFYGTRAVHRYVIHLAHELAAIESDVQYRLFSYRFRRVSGGNLPPASPPRIKHCWTTLPGRLLNICWDSFRWPPLEYFTGPVDAFHATDFDIPRLRSGTPVIFTVHGVSYLAAPGFLPRHVVEHSRGLLCRAIRRAELFITVSKTTGSQLLEHFPEVDGRIRPIPLGISPEFRPDKSERDLEILRAWKLERPYVLFVGALSRVKNVSTIIEAFRLLRVDYPELELVLAGPVGPGEEELFGDLENAQARGEVRLLGAVPQGTEQLPALYRNACMFAYPSRSEGWTSPPLEAMACGTPVVVSNVSSLPETVGPAALLVDPDDAEGLRHQMERLLTDSELRARMTALGREWSARFTWRATAEQTLAVYREAVSR